MGLDLCRRLVLCLFLRVLVCACLLATRGGVPKGVLGVGRIGGVGSGGCFCDCLDEKLLEGEKAAVGIAMDG